MLILMVIGVCVLQGHEKHGEVLSALFRLGTEALLARLPEVFLAQSALVYDRSAMGPCTSLQTKQVSRPIPAYMST